MTTRSPRDQGPDSFEDFVATVGVRMYRTALLLCGDHHTAEDLTQTTFAKVFASWGRVRRSRNPVAYCRTVLTHTWLSERRLKRSTERPVAELPDVPGDHPDHARRLDLIEALVRLGADERAVLVLRFYEDLSVAQTADLLRVSEAAVRKRCQRGIARLRDLLPPDLIDDPMPAPQEVDR